MIELAILGLVTWAAIDDCSKFSRNNKNNKSDRKKKTYRRKTRKDDSWLDAAWFHDHGQDI